jgi:hypothetical protein
MESRLEGLVESNPPQIWLDRKDVVGNLTLTAYNSELAQKRFRVKKASSKRTCT